MREVIACLEFCKGFPPEKESGGGDRTQKANYPTGKLDSRHFKHHIHMRVSASKKEKILNYLTRPLSIC
jgi:hypothetical protein